MNIGLSLLSISWLIREHFGPWLSFHSEVLAFVGIAAMLLGCLSGQGRALSVPFILLPVVIVAAIPILQFALGVTYFVGDALVSTIYLVGFGFSIFVGFVAGSKNPEPDQYVSIALAIALPALLSAGIGWCQWFNVDDSYPNFVVPSQEGLATGNIAQPNLLGTLLLMGLFAFTYLRRSRTVCLGTFLFVVFFISAALAMTQSRAAIVGALVLALFLILKKKQYLPQLTVFHIGGWFCAALIARPIMPHLASLLFLSSGGESMSLADANGRWEIWRQVLSAVFQAPWFGYGWNQTFRAQTVGALIHPFEMTYSYAHNGVLDLLAWNGLPLGLLIVLAVAYWLVTRIFAAKTPPSIFAMGTLLPVATQSMFEYPYAYANFLISAGLLIGVIESQLGVAKSFAVRMEIMFASYAAFIIVGALVALEYVDTEEDYRIVRFENLRIGDTPANYVVPHFRLLTHMGAMLDAARSLPAPQMSSAQLETLREASHRFPYGVLMYKYAVARSLNGDEAGGIRQMLELRAIFGERYYRQCKAPFTEATHQQIP